VRVDVAIVGAGPAGSTAAHRLAAAGVRVALLERATFPRDKACGDGVSGDGLAALARTGLGEWAAQFAAPEVLRLTAPDGQALDISPDAAEDHCYGRTIPRRLLDARLVQAAVEAGAHLLESTRVRQVERPGDGPVRIAAGGLTVEAELTILADGSNATVTRRLGLVRTEPEMVAVRQYFAGDAGPAERLEIHFERWITPGYTWVFPMNDGHANVGTGTFARRVRRGDVVLKDVLARFATEQAAAGGRLARAEAAGPVRGHLLRTRLGDTQTHAERVLVAGDAAGLVDPFSGEGIARALESGEMAAAHALGALEAGDLSARALSGYSRDLVARYRADQRASRILRLALNAPRLLNRVFARLQRDEELALLIGYILIGAKSPRLALHPATLMRLLA
jgi:geranylgeranyl reductase family protein